jgi:hypothetical protein
MAVLYMHSISIKVQYLSGNLYASNDLSENLKNGAIFNIIRPSLMLQLSYSRLSTIWALRLQGPAYDVLWLIPVYVYPGSGLYV